MPYSDTLYLWLIHSALVSLVVLIVGTAVVLLCRQPTRRVRIIELILIGCLVAPWLGMIPGYPQLAVGRWNTAEVVQRDVATPPPVEPTLVQATPRIVPPGDSIRLPDARSVSQSAASTAEMPAREPAATNALARRDADFDLLGVEAGSDTSERNEFRFTDIDFASWIVALYLLGVAIGAAWLLVGLAGLARIMLTGRPAPPHCRELLSEIAGPSSGRVRLIVSRWVHQPFAAAWGRPVIVLPENLCGDRQSLRWCLAHEWTHVERRDFRVWLLAGAVRVVFFYHPLVWWLRRQLRLCQDFVADAQAVGHAPQPEDYAEFLTVRAAAGSLHPAVVGLGMGFRKSELYRRIVMLVQNRPIESRAPRLWSVLVGLTALVLVATVAALVSAPNVAAQGQSDDPIANDEAKPSSAAKKSLEGKTSFTARLPNGILVELLGVSENPSKDRPWWRPDGSPLTERPYETVHADVHAEKGQLAREFAVALRNLPAEPISVELLSNPSYSGAGGGLKQAVKDGTMLDTIAMSLPAKETVTIRVGVAAGPWKTVQESARGEEATGSPTMGVAFSEVYEKDGDVFVAVAHNIHGPQTRVIAVTTDGQEHLPAPSSVLGASGFNLLTAVFSKVSLKDIQVFRLQTRPYQWVEFRNVSLQPGHKTHVTAVLSEPLFEPKQRQASSPSQTTSAAGVSPVEEESTKKIKQALVSPTTLEFIDAPLSDVVDYLKDYHQIEIQLDKKALDDVGIGSDTPITKSLNGVSLRTALRLLLKNLGLTYVIQGGVMVITTPEEADNGLETKVYPVGDLVLPPNSTAETSPDFEPLVNLIKTTVKPPSWEPGGVGSLVPFENSLSLTICQTQDVQEEVQQLLDQLRTASREQIKEGRLLFKPGPKTKFDAVPRDQAAGGVKKPAKSDPPPKPN